MVTRLWCFVRRSEPADPGERLRGATYDQEIVEREAAFHDCRAKRSSITPDLVRDYVAFDSPDPYTVRSVPRLKARFAAVLGDVADKRVLVYGCGSDSAALWFAKSGAIVDAIDISSESIENQRTMAQLAGLHLCVSVQDAHKTSLPSDCYDIVYGNAILHHLNVELAAQEIHRMLKPGGMAVFRDVMNGNVFLRMFRSLTPFWRTPDEHPLTRRDFEVLANRSSSCHVDEFYLLALPLGFFERIMNNVILRRLGLRIRVPHLSGLYAALDRIDCFLFKCVPYLRNQAWICLIKLSK